MQHLQSSLCTCFKRLPKFIFFYAASRSERQEIWTWKQIQFLPCFLGKQQALCYLRNVCLSNRASPKGDSELTLLPSPWGRLLWGGEKKRKQKKNQQKKHIKKNKEKKANLYVLRPVLLEASTSIWVLWLHLKCWTLASLSFESRQ